MSHYILGNRGIGGGVRENNANRFLLRMANLLIFIHNCGIWKVTIHPRLKMLLIFPVTKVFQKGTMFKWVCCTLTWDSISLNGRRQGGLSVQSQPFPSKTSPIGSPAKLAFRRLLASYIYGWYSRKLPSWAMNKFPFCHHCPFPILGKPSRTVNVIPVIVNSVVRVLLINLMAIGTAPVHRLLFATHTGFWLYRLGLSADHTD